MFDMNYGTKSIIFIFKKFNTIEIINYLVAILSYHKII
jgi:hypothetical protein